MIRKNRFYKSKYSDSRLYFRSLNSVGPKSKRSQQETVGFVLIIIIVAIIGLVFLWFFLRSPTKPTTSIKMSDLMQSSLYYTSNCSVTYIPNFMTGEDLIKKCYDSPNEKCDDGRSFCQALNDTMKGILKESLRYGEDVPIKGYRYTVIFDSVGTEAPEKKVLELSQGVFANCTTRYGGSSPPLFSRTGNIEARLEICEKVNKNTNLEKDPIG